MKKIIFLLVIFLTTATIIRAQNIIRGTVQNENNEPLIGATVFIPELNKGTITNNVGEFTINNIPSGKIKIQFSFVGYNTKVQGFDVNNYINEINIKLSEAVIATQEVVVSGGHVNSQHENAVKIDVIKTNRIELSGTPNLMESLTQVSGVDMISKGQGVAKPVIRGLSMNNILVLNNGVRIENYQFGENHPLGVDGNNIEQVEIIKGPASLLYGSDAIGGVINFIKENPAPTGKIMGKYNIQLHSNTKGYNQSFCMKSASNNFFGSFQVGQNKHSDYIQGNGDFVPNSRFNELSLNVNAGYTNNKITTSLFYDYFQQQLGMSVPPAIALVKEDDYKNRVWYQDLEHHTLSFLNKIYFGNIKWEINTAYQKAMRKLQTIEDVPTVEMDLQTLTYETKIHINPIHTTEYILGIQGMSQFNRNRNNRAEQFLPNADINNLGILGLVQHDFNKNFKLQSGVRYDWFQTETFALGEVSSDHYHDPVLKNYSNLNGSLGVTYNMENKWFFRTNLAKAYRVPNVSELTSSGTHGNRFESGNHDLVPQNSYQTDASLHYHGKFLSFDLAGFYNLIDNYIYLSPTNELVDDNIPVFKYQQVNATMYGSESGVHFHPQQLSWLHLKATYSIVIGKQKNEEYLPFIPAQKFNYEIRAKIQSLGKLKHTLIKLSALTALEQNKPASDETKTEGYTVYNTSINTNVAFLKQYIVIGLSVNNILDTKYIDHLSTLKPLGYYNQGRNISLFIKVPFAIK